MYVGQHRAPRPLLRRPAAAGALVAVLVGVPGFAVGNVLFGAPPLSTTPQGASVSTGRLADGFATPEDDEDEYLPVEESPGVTTSPTAPTFTARQPTKPGLSSTPGVPGASTTGSSTRTTTTPASTTTLRPSTTRKTTTSAPTSSTTSSTPPTTTEPPTTEPTTTEPPPADPGAQPDGGAAR